MEALAHLLVGPLLGLHTSAMCAVNGEGCASPSKAKELARRRRRAPGLSPGSGGLRGAGASRSALAAPTRSAPLDASRGPRGHPHLSGPLGGGGLRGPSAGQ